MLIAPDKFAGTLSAREAAGAIAEGWRRARPDDRLDLAPMSDGGPGFIDVLAARLTGRLIDTEVRGPAGEAVGAQLLVADGATYIESAQACGIHLTRGRAAEHATTFGVGQLVDKARAMGATRIVVGLGGTGANDGGAGFLAALGATGDTPLDKGCSALRGLSQIHLPSWDGSTELIMVSDVDNELSGPRGASVVFGPQKGLATAELQDWDVVLARYARLVSPASSGRPGAGAAGGLGFGMLALGAKREPGADFVARALSLPTRIGASDVVITGEGSFDATTAGGKVPAGVASRAAAAQRECVVIAGRVTVAPSVAREFGVTSAHSLISSVGEERALGSPAAAVAEVAERVAREWASPEARGVPRRPRASATVDEGPR